MVIQLCLLFAINKYYFFMNLILHKNGRWINKSKNSRHMGGDVDLQLINCNLHVYIAVNAIKFHNK